MSEFKEHLMLRTAEPGDEAFLLSLFSGGRADLEWADLSEKDKDELIRRQYFIQQKQLLTYYPFAEYNIVLLGEQPIGRIYIYKGETVYRILDIILLPQYRRMGIGTKLLKDILREAAVLCKGVELEVAWYNDSATRLYKKLGFHTIEDKGVCCEMQWSPEG